MPSITLKDSRILGYTLSSTDTNLPLVILANWLGAPLAAWDHIANTLHEHNFRTLRYDQPGHGTSSAPQDLTSTTFDSLAEDVMVLLKELGIEKVYGWIGVSMGAATGMYFVTRYPGVLERVILADTNSAPVVTGTEDVFAARLKAAKEDYGMEGATQAALERWFSPAWMASNAEEVSRLRKIMLGTTIEGFETCCHALRDPTFDLMPVAEKIGSSVERVVLVVGEHDGVMPEAMEGFRKGVERGFKQAGKKASVELVTIEGAGHVSVIDGFEQFRGLMLDFMSAN